MKKKLTFVLTSAAFILCSLQQTHAQNWKFGGNATPTDTTLGTTNNRSLRLITNGTEKMRILPMAE